MSSAAVANGGAVAAGSSVATLQSIGATGCIGGLPTLMTNCRPHRRVSEGPALAAAVCVGAVLGGGAMMAYRYSAQGPTEAEATSSPQSGAEEMEEMEDESKPPPSYEAQ